MDFAHPSTKAYVIPANFILFYSQCYLLYSNWRSFDSFYLDLTRSHFHALDIDECSTGKAMCSFNRKCVNTFGSYYCKCQIGYDMKYVNGQYDCIGKNWVLVLFIPPPTNLSASF